MAKIQDIVADSVIFEEGALRLDGDVASADLGDKNNHFYGVVEGVRGFHEVVSSGGELPDAPEAVFIGSATLLTGTITNFTDPTLTGVGTQFLSEVSIGDLLTVAPTPGDDPWSPLKSGFFEVTGVTSDTVLEVTAHGDYEVNNVNLPLLIKVSSTLPAPGGDGSLFDGFASIEEAFATYSFANPEKEYNIHIIAGDINAELPIEYLAAPVGVAVTLYAWVPPASINVRSCTLVKLRITCHHGTHNISIENSANVLLETHEENIQGDISVYDSRNIQIDTFATYLEVSGDSSLSVYGADETYGLKVSHLFNYPAAAENTAAFTDDGDRMVLPGMTFFHTTLGKPVWYSGTDWVDATGTTIQEE